MKNKGFILLEVLLSLVILGTVFVVSFQALSGYIRSTSSSINLNIAAAILQELYARIIFNEFNGSISEGKSDNKYPVFSWSVNKTDISDCEKQYEIIVKWAEHGQDKYLKTITGKFVHSNNQ